MRFYKMYICVFLCSRHENSHFVVKPHGGGFLLKCRFTRVTLLSPNFQRIFFWKPSFWVETPATQGLWKFDEDWNRLISFSQPKSDPITSGCLMMFEQTFIRQDSG